MENTIIIPTNVKTTYFIKGQNVLGFLDTARLPSWSGGDYETMDFIGYGYDSAKYCEEHATTLVDALALHDAWSVIIAHRLNATAITTSIMGADAEIGGAIKAILNMYRKDKEEYRKSLTID